MEGLKRIRKRSGRKKGLGILLAAALLAGMLAGCGGGNGSDGGSQPQESTGRESEAQAESEAQTGSEDGPSAGRESETPDLTSLEMAERMGNGINLGNTMEAYGRASLGVGAQVSAYETAWGMPVTTKEMAAAMKEAGFDTLRIPVAWTNAMAFETGDYTIGKEYLDRVEEIVGYAIDADMYVIVNDHWDGGWWGMFGSADQQTRQNAMELYTSMWTQIAERFEKYDSHLIFESANEELGFRLNDTDIAKDSGTLSDDDCYRVANEINQAFVDTVRASGGNNENRFLLIAGFGTDINSTCDDRFQMPADSAQDKLLLSVHFYDPSGYCINTSLASWGTKQDYEQQNTQLEKMTKFTRQGYGIVIGEYGVLLDNGRLKENTAEYVTNFLNNCDLYGYCPVLWDCSNLFDRNRLEIIDGEMAALYLEHSYSAQKEIPAEELQSSARAAIEAACEAAPEANGVAEDVAMAWLMYTSGDWNVQNSVGDVYAPDDKTAGVAATDVEITGEGTYTVGLDFTGTAGGYASGMTFSAVAVANGETLYPGYCIEIKEILVNGEPYKLTGRPYTTSDDGVCTRLNLYNSWVTQAPDTARTASGNVMYVTPTVMDPEDLGSLESIYVTFEYKPGK